ncbi:YczI family protein [Cytobacillus stercorigallinarum]|uniref:YczI family protein n=1 Tax=Cytobacillus stercorigallinarum TaxID=2762240 RepID=UPI001CD914C2|nr:YczI family protein [Cytobacillus stercorigallinarum]
MRILRYVFSVIWLVMASYGVMTKDFRFSDIMILFLGLTMLVLGLEAFKKEQRGIGVFLIVVFLFSFYVSIEWFLIN